MTSTVLVIGASRGIGLELVRQYLDEGWTVHATTRTPAAPGFLGTLSGDLTVHELDVRNRDHLDRLLTEVEGTPLDVMIHNAGIYRARSPEEMIAVNVEAPLRIADALAANVAAGERRILALMSSGMGARRGRRHSAGSYAASKALLNDGLRERADRWGAMGIIAVVVNPGWVRTDMGGRSAPLAVEDSVAGIRRLVDGLTTAMHGRFWSWDGTEHPW